MKMKYKHICFEELIDIGYQFANKENDELLGTVMYSAGWKQWVVDFEEDRVFSSSCLKDVASFLEQLNKKQHKMASV